MTSLTYRSVVFKGVNQPLELITRPLPSVVQGSVVVRVLALYMIPQLKSFYSGESTLPVDLSPPFTPSAGCIARVHAVGTDASVLVPGQLVFCDVAVRARDEPSIVMSQGLRAGDAPHLMRQWADGAYAEYAVFPLENVYPLDEARLIGELGLEITDLCLLRVCAVAYGALSSIDVKPGDTVIICPATGNFSGAAVGTALAMGATVIAAARNKESLGRLVTPWKESTRIKTVAMSGDTEADAKSLKDAAGGMGADCFVDYSPPESAMSTHITACLEALRSGGRVAFSGGCPRDINIPYVQLILKRLRIIGVYIYERWQLVQLIKMVEAGLLPLGERAGVKAVATFSLDEMDEAMDVASKEKGWGKQVLLMP